MTPPRQFATWYGSRVVGNSPALPGWAAQLISRQNKTTKTMQNVTATYSPEDNKLRLYSSHRLDKEEYEAVTSAGFRWAPRQECFIAPAWTPEREDAALALAGEIGDEDKGLLERAEERSERFEGYEDNRREDAERARAGVEAIAGMIPMGQPILIGHHSEKRARRDQERIESGMRKTIRAFETAEYWRRRAAAAIRAAKYKERPDVRARRIKGLEAELRRYQREIVDLRAAVRRWEKLETMEQLADQSGLYHTRIAAREGEVCNLISDGKMPMWCAFRPAAGWTIQPRTFDELKDEGLAQAAAAVDWRQRWIDHTERRLEYERAMLEADGGTVSDQIRPEVGGGVRCWASHAGCWSWVVKVNRVSVTVLDNWGNGGRNFTRTIPFDKLGDVMTPAQVREAKAAGLLIETADKIGFSLVRKAPEPAPTADPAPEDKGGRDDLKAAVEGMRKTEIKAVAVDQLFPTPAPLADQMAALLDAQEGDKVLEPSVGRGDLICALARRGFCGRVVAFEVNCTIAEMTGKQFADPRLVRVQACPDFVDFSANASNVDVTVYGGDFLDNASALAPTFDRILMNPPFANGAAIAHIEAAVGLLSDRPGSRLVALVPAGPREAIAFQDRPGWTWEDLPPGSFKEAGTMVRVALVTFTR